MQQPDKVDSDALLGIFPYGQPSVRVVKGGLDVAKPDGSGVSVIANVAIIVSFDMAAAGAASTSSAPGQSAGGQA